MRKCEYSFQSYEGRTKCYSKNLLGKFDDDKWYCKKHLDSMRYKNNNETIKIVAGNNHHNHSNENNENFFDEEENMIKIENINKTKFKCKHVLTNYCYDCNEWICCGCDFGHKKT